MIKKKEIPKQFLTVTLVLTILAVFLSSAFAHVTIPQRPIYFPFGNGAYLTFDTSILPLIFSGNPQSVYRDTINRWHFGPVWTTSTTDMTVTAWFSNNWLNYTVPSSGTQQISNGSKPTSVYIDGVNKTEGVGWSYSGGTVTVTGATSSASLYWGTGGTPSVTVTITYPENTTYTTPTVSVQLSAVGGTIDKILWNCTFTNGTVAYANTVYTVPTSMTLGNGSYIFNARANNTLGEWDEATVMFTVEIPATSSNTIGYQLGQATIAAAGFMGIVMLLAMVYVAAEGKDVKYAVMLAVGEVLLLVTMLILSQLAILG